MTEKIVDIGEGDFRVEFKVFKRESNRWVTLGTVYYETVEELLVEKTDDDEKDFKAEFGMFDRKSNSWEPLAVVQYETIGELLTAITKAVEIATQSILSKLKKH